MNGLREEAVGDVSKNGVKKAPIKLWVALSHAGILSFDPTADFKLFSPFATVIGTSSEKNSA